MTSHITPGEPKLPIGAITINPPIGVPARRRFGKRSLLLVVTAGLLLAAGGAGAWWWLRRPAPVEPPMPQDIRDPEVLQAIERARQAVLDKPGSAYAWGRLGMTFLGNLFDREADRCFAEAARLDPADERWPYCRGMIALRRDSEKAVPFLRQAVALGRGPTPTPQRAEDRGEMRLVLAETLLERRQIDEADELLREEWRRRPGSPRAALGLGMVAVARGKDGDAQEYFTAARASKSFQKKATSQLAALARARGQEAIAAGYEKEAAALPDDPPWPDPLLEEVVRLQVGQRGREREVNELEEQHRFEEAAQAYLRDIEQQPTAWAYVGAGLNLSRIGEFERALPLLHEGVRLEPDKAQSHYVLALALFTRAEKEWQRNPGSDRAKEWFGAAVPPAKRATELKPDYARAYLLWGLALKYLGEPAAAVAPLSRGVACLPSDFELQFGLGEVLLASDDLPKAETHLENARKLDPKDRRLESAFERLRKKKG